MGLEVAHPDPSDGTFVSLGGWPGVLTELLDGVSLSAEQAETVLDEILSGAVARFWRDQMTILIMGGTGFIGRRLVHLLAERGEEVVCADINPATAAFESLGKQVRVVRGDVTQFDEVMAATADARPSRIVNFAYSMGSDFPPRMALKLNIIGADNCFEAARLWGIERVVFGSSLAVSGPQKMFGERMVDENDFCYARDQYGTHKIFNEWQAQDYREKYGMDIVAVRPAQVTGYDKVVGSVDHVQCITAPAKGEPISFPFKDLMKVPIHVDDVAEIFARIVLAPEVEHPVYNTGGTPISLGEIAEIVRDFITDADIGFDNETGGKDLSYNYLIDNSRLVDEFGFRFRPYRERVLQIINEVRSERGLQPVDRR